MWSESPPILALSVGEPGGIGPEITAKALAVAEVRQLCRPLVIGWVPVLQGAAEQLHLGMKVRLVRDVADARFEPDQVDVYQASSLIAGEFTVGQASATAGRAALEALAAAANLAMEGKVGGVVTGPISREALGEAGTPCSGQTEFLAGLAGAPGYAVMLVAGSLRVVHLSTHLPLREAIEQVKTERIVRSIQLAYQGCRLLGIEEPHLAVAGLNPHAGAGIGGASEERDQIEPAIAQARAEGIQVEGPARPDTIFLRASKGEFSAVIAMYHDQGHIPTRMAAFKTAVNVTLGLPFVRTSVDHGPAYDIAGKGLADPANMVEAIRLAAQMARVNRFPIAD